MIENLGIVYVDAQSQWIHTIAILVFIGLLLILYLFKNADKLLEMWDSYYKTKDKIEGPFGFGHNFFEFITIIVRSILKFFLGRFTND
ncbi:hypothetical protein [Companilactobacillus metriopterae]|uniref:hypothetical protein n=1 Tax=Companilactobacillus metriopterae TaxID=1909267 RepID=UPI00100A809E|nr:hypothetical protein [Companilactobacillus metriopterae]